MSTSTNPSAFCSDAFSFVVLGGGAVSTRLHLPALRTLGALQRACVAEPDAGVLARVQRLFPEVRTEQLGFEAFLRRTDTHAAAASSRTLVIVALPNQLHASAVELALRRGFHVLCEKPLALDAATCLRLHALASECRRTLAVGMVRRLLPSVTALRAALADDLIGRPERIDVAHGGAYAWPVASKAPFERGNGGVLADMGIHYLDLVEHLFGALEPVAYRDDARGGVEANCELSLRVLGQVPVRLALSRTHALDNRLLVRGSRGELEMQVDAFDGCTWRASTGQRLHGRLQLERPFASGPWTPTFASCFVEQLEQVAQAIARDAAPPVSAAEAARGVELVEWAYARRVEARPAAPAASGGARPALAPAPVVVTGGTGFIGQHLIERLVELGFESVRVPMRSFRTCAGVARFAVDLARTDLLDRKQVDAAVHGARHVFHLAYGRDGADGARVTVEGTRNVVEAAIGAGAESVVVLSTMYVFGHPDGEAAIDERAGYQPAGGEYGASKARMEKWCLERARSSKTTRIVVLNPSCVYGPGGGAYTELPARLTANGAFCWVEGGSGVANYNYVDNLVDAIVLAASCEAAHGERFLISDGTCTWKTFLTPLLGSAAERLPSYSARELQERPDLPRASTRDVLKHLANDLQLIAIVNRMPVAGRFKRALFKRVPRVRGALMDIREVDAEFSAAALRVQSAERRYPPPWVVDLYGPTRTRFSSAKAHRVLGWQPLVPLAQGQARARAWVRAIGTLPDDSESAR